MGEIRFVGTGETRGYPYPVCKKRIVGPGKTRGYPYPVCKKKSVNEKKAGSILWHCLQIFGYFYIISGIFKFDEVLRIFIIAYIAEFKYQLACSNV